MTGSKKEKTILKEKIIMKLYKFNIHTNDGIATVVAQTKLDAYEIALGIWTDVQEVEYAGIA